MDKQIQAVVELAGLSKPISPINQISIIQQMGNHMSFDVSFPIEVLESGSDNFGQQSRQALGKMLTISFHYSDKSGKMNIFKGLITDVYTAKYQQRGDEIVVRGESPTILLDGAPKCQSFTNKTLQQIVTTILADYPQNELNPSVQPKFTQPIPYITQYFENDFAFIIRMAIHYGEVCYWSGEQFIFGEQAPGNTIPLQLVKDLKYFEMTQSVATTAYRIRGYDPVKNQIFESASTDATTPSLGSHADYALKESDSLMSNEGLVPNRFAFQSNSQLTDYIKNRRMQDLNDLIKFTASSDNPYLKLGAEVDISSPQGDPKENRLENIGKFRIISISFSMDSSGNFSSMFEGEPSGANLPPSRTSLRYPVCQNQTAIVKDNNDPEGLGRVRVQFGWQQTPEKTPWIRSIMPYAGAQSNGFFFVPEIGDEVYVGFEHQNPDLPFVMGSTYNGGQKPINWVDAANNKKAIHTRSGNLIYFYDEQGAEAIRITNENYESEIHLSFANNGVITIKTSGELFLAADAKITLTTDGDIEFFGSTFKVDVENIILDAKQGITIKSKAAVELSGKTVDIKGTPIKLN